MQASEHFDYLTELAVCVTGFAMCWQSWQCVLQASPSIDSNEAVALRKHVTKYKNVRKWMAEFFKKSESRGDKIARVNPIRITKYINLL